MKNTLQIYKNYWRTVQFIIGNCRILGFIKSISIPINNRLQSIAPQTALAGRREGWRHVQATPTQRVELDDCLLRLRRLAKGAHEADDLGAAVDWRANDVEQHHVDS